MQTIWGVGQKDLQGISRPPQKVSTEALAYKNPTNTAFKESLGIVLGACSTDSDEFLLVLCREILRDIWRESCCILFGSTN